MLTIETDLPPLGLRSLVHGDRCYAFFIPSTIPKIRFAGWVEHKFPTSGLQNHGEVPCHSTYGGKCTNLTKHLALSWEPCLGWGHWKAPKTNPIFLLALLKLAQGNFKILCFTTFLNSPNPCPSTSSTPVSLGGKERHPPPISKLS